MSLQKIAIFDFCCSLVNFHTADEFVNFCSPKLTFFNKIKYSFYSLLFKVRLISSETHKRHILLRLSGLSESHLQKKSELFVSEKLLTRTIPKSIELLKHHQSQGHLTAILSGG